MLQVGKLQYTLVHILIEWAPEFGKTEREPVQIQLAILHAPHKRPAMGNQASHIHTATCACGEVEFSLTGAPVFHLACCCNDRVTLARYVDALAASHATNNTSALEIGNHQSATNVLWPAGGVRLVRDRDKIAYLKLRPGSTTVRTYTTCCYTTTIQVRLDSDFL